RFENRPRGLGIGTSHLERYSRWRRRVEQQSEDEASEHMRPLCLHILRLRAGLLLVTLRMHKATLPRTWQRLKVEHRRARKRAAAISCRANAGAMWDPV